MKTNKMLTMMVFGALNMQSVFAADHDPKVIMPLLKDAKYSLVDGINYAEAKSGVATSAKFEVSDGKLVLSVYTIPEGLAVEPEKASLTELHGLATEDLSTLVSSIFTDKEHIARASVHMTLFQLTKLSLKQVIERALLRQPGTPIDVRNPLVRARRAIADVIIVTDEQKVFTVSVDLLSGKTRLQSDY